MGVLNVKRCKEPSRSLLLTKTYKCTNKCVIIRNIYYIMVNVTLTSGAISGSPFSYFGNALMISKDGLNIIVGGRDGTGGGIARVYKFSGGAKIHPYFYNTYI